MTDTFERLVRSVLAIDAPLADRERRAPEIQAHANPFRLGPLLQRLTPRNDSRIRVRVQRPEDHLVFDMLLDNLRIAPDGDAGAALVRVDAGRNGVLVVEFPPQSFGEEAFLAQRSNADVPDVKADLPAIRDGAAVVPGKTADKQNVAPPASPESLTGRLPARVRMAGPSRLAFAMPADVPALPFTLDAVLDAMRVWPMNLDFGARPDAVDLGPLVLFERGLFDRLSDALTTRVRAGETEDFQRALSGGARRIAEMAAGGLNRAGGATGRVAASALRRESTALFARHPDLAEGDLHTATLAALSLGAADRLSGMAENLGLRIEAAEVFADLPYVSLLRDTPHQPAPSATALELPYRMILSPIGAAQWRHRLAPATRNGRTELWHTRLGDPAPATGAERPARVRALWSPDVEGEPDPELPFRMSLDGQDRQFLVRLMADWTQKRAGSRRDYLPVSSEAKRLHLSALGALFDAQGDWEPRPNGVDLEQWRHLATLGRDQYVRVVYTGFFVPFRHAASLVKVTERKFEPMQGAPHQRIAVLRQRFFLVRRQAVVDYDGGAHEHGGRNFPFTRVELLTPATPVLDAPKALPEPRSGPGDPKIYGSLVIDGKPLAITPRMAFWPKIAGAPFRFDLAATDRDGRRIGFSMPLLFVSEIVNMNRMDLVREAYDAVPGSDGLRDADLGGASVRFDAQPGDSTLSTRRMSFFAGASKPAQPPATAPRFHPEMDVAEIAVPALQKLLGRDDPIPMRYPAVVRDALPNPGEIYLAVANGPYTLGFGGGGKAQTDALGGLAAPQMAVLGLSKRSGPVSGTTAGAPETALATAIDNVFDPADFFPLDATLIGGIALKDLFDVLNLSTLDAPSAPRMLATEFPDRVESRFDWTTQVTRPDHANLLIPDADGVRGTQLALSGRVSVPLDDPQAATREAHATLDNFKLNLFGCIVLWFERLAFDAEPGRKPDVSVQLRDGDDAVRFGGPLEFVNDLRQFIPSNGFSDPPSLSVTPSGIAASYSLGLPTIGVGIFELSNVSLGAGFNLPFDNRPVSVRFNFAERQRPFSLTVSLLGGGGFFAIAVGAKGVQEIEAALEFGAAIALNLVVASGTVEIKAGVYFNWKDDGASPQRVVLAGYVRIHGELTIVAIFSASLTFNLQLGYQKSNGVAVVYGEAELIVEVEVLFLSFDVAVRCRREFGGGAADPKFLDLIPDQTVWDEYCAAFALEAA